VNAGYPNVDPGPLVVIVVVKRAPIEKVRDSDSDHVRDRVGRGGDDDDRANARRTVVDQCVGDPAEALGRVVIAMRRRVEARPATTPPPAAPRSAPRAHHAFPRIAMHPPTDQTLSYGSSATSTP
jgi:hypothetical protein